MLHMAQIQVDKETDEKDSLLDSQNVTVGSIAEME